MPVHVEHRRPEHVVGDLLLCIGGSLTRKSEHTSGVGGVGEERPHVEHNEARPLWSSKLDPTCLETTNHRVVVSQPLLAYEHIDPAVRQIHVARDWLRLCPGGDRRAPGNHHGPTSGLPATAMAYHSVLPDMRRLQNYRLGEYQSRPQATNGKNDR